MAQFTFSGDPKAPGTDPANTVFGSIVFPLGQAVQVKDEAVAAKLRTHSHFTETKEKAEKPAAPPVLGLKAVHIAGGRFKIVNGDEVVQTGLNKADAAAFNALSAEDKAQYVSKKPE